jgi:hypothetical protein
MKRIILIMMAIALTATMVNAQTEEKPKEEVKTLFSGFKGIKSNFYAGPSIKFSKVNDESAIFIGGRGAWTLNKTFSIGIAGYGDVKEHRFSYMNNDTPIVNSDINFSYGGLYFEYIFMPREYIHCSANVLFAFGGSSLNRDSSSLFSGLMKYTDSDPWKHYLVVEPTLAIEFNITSFFRIAVEGSYRIANDIYTSEQYDKIPDLRNKKIQLNGLSYGLTLEFGIF